MTCVILHDLATLCDNESMKKLLQVKSQGRFFTIIIWGLTTLIMTHMGIYSMEELYVS